MGKVFKPKPPKKTDSYAKHLKYAEDLVKWDNAVAEKAKQDTVKEHIRKGDINSAMKIANGSSASKKAGAKKRTSISL